MALESFVLQTLTAYRISAVFGGAFLFGETVIISAFFLAAQLHWPVWEVFIAAFVGTIVSDSVWYIFGRSFRPAAERWISKHNNSRLLTTLEPLSRRQPALALLYIKFFSFV